MMRPIVVLAGIFVFAGCKARVPAGSQALSTGTFISKSFTGTYSASGSSGTVSFSTGVSRIATFTGSGSGVGGISVAHDNYGPALTAVAGRSNTLSAIWDCNDAFIMTGYPAPSGAAGQNCTVEVEITSSSAFNMTIESASAAGGSAGSGSSSLGSSTASTLSLPGKTNYMGTVPDIGSSGFNIELADGSRTIVSVESSGATVRLSTGATLSLDRSASSSDTFVYGGTISCRVMYDYFQDHGRTSSALNCGVVMIFNRRTATWQAWVNEDGSTTIPTRSGSSAGGGGTSSGTSGGSGTAGGSGSVGVTGTPENLPLNSSMDVDAVAKGICDIYNESVGGRLTSRTFVTDCYNVTPPTWSPIMQAYYCQYPVYSDGSSTPGVRACFTGSAQGRSYTKIIGYRNIYNFCIGRPEFRQVSQSTERTAMFQYIMMSQINPSSGDLYPSAASQPRFDPADQRDAIQKARSLCGIP